MNDISIIENDINNKFDTYRKNHIFSVRDECLRLSNIFELDDIDIIDIEVAALLHDITKSYNFDEQIVLAEQLGIKLAQDDVNSPKTLHAITGSAYAAEHYSDFVNSSVALAIRSHTVGRENMTIVEKLLYLADYIEPLRTFEDCVAVREYFNSAIKGLTNYENKIAALNKTLIFSFDLTIRQIIDEGGIIHPQTIKSRNYLINT